MNTLIYYIVQNRSVNAMPFIYQVSEYIAGNIIRVLQTSIHKIRDPQPAGIILRKNRRGWVIKSEFLSPKPYTFCLPSSEFSLLTESEFETQYTESRHSFLAQNLTP